MPSELDRRFDRKMAEVNGPGGVIEFGYDDKGQAIATNMPATIPGLLAAFCKVNAEHEAIVAGDERFKFPEVAEWSGRIARGLVARGIKKGDRVAVDRGGSRRSVKGESLHDRRGHAWPGTHANRAQSVHGPDQVSTGPGGHRRGTLEKISERTAGKYYRADNATRFQQIYAEIDRLEKTEKDVKKFARHRELFAWAITPGLGLLLLDTLLRHTWWRRLP